MAPALDWTRIDIVLCDMDGTLLDLDFDDMFWQQEIPRQWGLQRDLELAAAQQELAPLFARHRGSLQWYCLDFWSQTLGLDVRALKQQHAAQIRWLPGVLDSVTRLRAAGWPVVLLTNAHPDALHIKAEQTGLLAHLDGAHSTHAFGAPKEQPQFWSRFAQITGIDLARAVLIDDTVTVLEGALEGGVGQVLGMRQPSSRGPVRPAVASYPEVTTLAELPLPQMARV